MTLRKRWFIAPLHSIFSLFLVCNSNFAQTVSPDAFNGLQWRLIGPFRGGRVVAVAGVPGDNNTYYFGAVDGGVWKTTDAGRTWTPIMDSQPIASIGAIAVAPSNPQILYVGTGESDIRSALSSGDGVYKSGDGGRPGRTLVCATRGRSAASLSIPTIPMSCMSEPWATPMDRMRSEGSSSRPTVAQRGRTGLVQRAGFRRIGLAIAAHNPNDSFRGHVERRIVRPGAPMPRCKGRAVRLYRSIDGWRDWTQLYRQWLT